jgi:excisionase family DNA binding protein
MAIMKLSTIDEVASSLNISVTTVRRWVSSGQIPSYKVGRVLRFNFDEVLQSLRQDAKMRSDRSLKTWQDIEHRLK